MSSPPMPTLERVNVAPAMIATHLRELDQRGIRPDGEELVSARAVRTCRAQIADGYYLRLVWPPGTTAEQAIEWHELIALFRHLGLIA